MIAIYSENISIFTEHELGYSGEFKKRSFVLIMNIFFPPRSIGIRWLGVQAKLINSIYSEKISMNFMNIFH